MTRKEIHQQAIATVAHIDRVAGEIKNWKLNRDKFLAFAALLSMEGFNAEEAETIVDALGVAMDKDNPRN